MPDGFLEMDPEVVASAGRATAATSTQWAAWAGQAETQLRAAASGAGDSVVTAAFETYVSTWNPKLQSLAGHASTLGGNTVSGANVVDGADADSAALLRQQQATEAANGSWLSRPIEG
jgi:hypothetical protein